MSKRLLVAGVVTSMLAIAGCQSIDDVDTSIQKSLPQICSGADYLHTTFIAVAATGAIPEDVMQKEAQAWGVLEPLCVDPSKATSTTVLVVAANAYIVIAQALRDAD